MQEYEKYKFYRQLLAYYTEKGGCNPKAFAAEDAQLALAAMEEDVRVDLDGYAEEGVDGLSFLFYWDKSPQGKGYWAERDVYVSDESPISS